MAESPVVNASPLILLARAGLLDMLQLAGSHLIIPRPVADEISARGSADPTAAAISNAKWLTIEDPGPTTPVIGNWDLGPGESSVLTWASAHPGAEAIIDDLAGRRCAQALGIPVRGTLGLILTAQRRGVIPSARQILDVLRQHGMYLSTRVMDEALAKIGE